MRQKGIGRVCLLLVAFIIAAMMLPSCAAGEGEETLLAIKNPDTFIQATIADVDSLDPAYAYDSASGEQIQAIYEPLLYFDGESTSEFVPVLATEWTVSEDGLTYRFKIREGVTFHNGNDLTPDDVEYSFERGMVQDYGSSPQWLFFSPLLGIYSSRTNDSLVPLEDITDAIEVDGDWVQFNLTNPFPPFLKILCQSWASIVDREWCIENGDWDGTQASYEALNNPAAGGSPLQSIANGTGPYKLERWDAGIEISLVRNDDYWGEPASFERFITKVVEEWTTRKLMLEAGDADWVHVPTANVSELERVEGLTVYENLPQLETDTIFFQFDISPDSTFIGSGQLDGEGIPTDFFQDTDVRRGFAYAFDYDTYIEDGLSGNGQRLASPIVYGLAYVNPDAPMYEFDLAKAEEHLRAAWDGEVWENGFNLTICSVSGNVGGSIACEILQANLLAINEKFVVDIQLLQWGQFLDNFGLMPLFQVSWTPDYPDPHSFAEPFMHSQGIIAGIQGYSNPEADALLDQGIVTVDEDEREAIYYELQYIYYEDVPGIMLAQPVGQRYFRNWVQGYIFNPVDPGNIGHVYNLSKEYN